MLHFTGVPLQTLIQIGALAGAVIVVFYILKLRRRPVAVPFSKIWTRILRDKEATSLFSQLKRLLSLLLQLALLALLLLALGDPRTVANMVEGRNIVILIDASASMKATDVAPSRIDSAKERVRTMVRGLSGSDRMLIAQMDAAVTPLSTLTGEISELEAGLSAVKAVDASADFARGLRFAADTLRGLSSPEIIVVSDGALGEPTDAAGPVHLGDIKLSYSPLGQRARNAAITAASGWSSAATSATRRCRRQASCWSAWASTACERSCEHACTRAPAHAHSSHQRDHFLSRNNVTNCASDAASRVGVGVGAERGAARALQDV